MSDDPVTGKAPQAATEKLRGSDELRYRLRQQSLLGEFARQALLTRDFGQILQRATELCALGLETPFAKVLEYIPETDRLLVRAGVGWAPGTVGEVTLGADIDSPAGFSYQTGQAVISNHLQAETRFRTPRLLVDHGIKRAINVLITRGGEGAAAFGVLEVDSDEIGQFDQGDAYFLDGFAGLLGIAIERQQADAKLQSALEHQALLTREMSHRVKNSLTSVVSLLRVQGRSATSQAVQDALADASSRVATIAQVHDHLWRGSKVGYVELADFLSELCGNLQGNSSGHTLRCEADAMLIAADHAIPLGLIVNELVTNAVKYAYPGGAGVIDVIAHEIDGRLHLEIADHGVGLPIGFDIDQPRGSLGFKVVKGLVQQLQGRLEVAVGADGGARFLVDVPVLLEN
ncbi:MULTISPECIES: histidine kinase dimerization/phosphoacceptor domain -containing protein [Rhodopseudomonas]|uniref:histidine kinase n=1 Tax=Rhodopseudomonas palustris TaxID=1076 RepID=A0A0D7ETJ4_RHOPL|nr:MULTISPECIES: histidine kinase dimerization/phosphoacceptor domain -containing protein [Rhodopseudomonas]KIZ44164.1 histidine kinase [Rhodopseudomonas palustris]MDF3810117.1 histidine kinase dimerization/phosphoacceptor domain -containing protein [Rhodopseudomonas sp. BAL398]WOK19297.1 histidine kinase dimerization/phosphoacceptor domain -containing protein [Rhodopseudomonas sp. BAL398]